MLIAENHMAPAKPIRNRLKQVLDLECVYDGAALDVANDDGHPLKQAIYVEFAGEHTSDMVGADHLWHVWLIQRRDYPEWEVDYGRARACLFSSLNDWQPPGLNVHELSLVRDRSGIQDLPGLRVDLTAWRISEMKFAR